MITLICGHVAHFLEFALRSYMAGTVGRSVGLDAEYYCRDVTKKKTDLMAADSIPVWYLPTPDNSKKETIVIAILGR